MHGETMKIVQCLFVVVTVKKCCAL